MFWNLMSVGGPVMWIILCCVLLAIFIFLVKLFQFHRDEISVRELLRGLFNVLTREHQKENGMLEESGMVEALTLCDHTPGPVARLLAAGILAQQQGEIKVRAALDAAAIEEIPKLERGVTLLGTFAYIMPLLGLLGTVLGLLEAFEVIKASQYFSAADIGGPVGKALLTSAAGLAAAIPCHLAYNYLVIRIRSMTLDMEKAAIELESFFERLDNSGEQRR